MSGSDEILGQARVWREGGHRVALATVVQTWGSAPRQAGGHMVICDTGSFVGSVSGGCVEAAVVDEAKGVMTEGASNIVEYGVTDDEAWAVGLACGGRVRISIVPVGDAGLPDDQLGALLKARREKEPAVLVSWLDSGRHTLLRTGAENVAAALDPTIVGAAGEALLSDRATVIETAEGEVMLRPHNPPVRVVIVGAVHLAQALVPLVASAGYEPVVVDPRAAFATEERFPGIRLVRSWPREALEEMGLDHRTAVVTLTHDPKLDDPALQAALSGEPFYIGALGSRRTHETRLARLESEGIPPAACARIHAPVGLDIGARTPNEIAVSIVAEIVEALRAAPARTD